MTDNNRFDVTNLDHLNAYKYLTEKGVWPEDFKCAFSLLNLGKVQGLMAKRWTDAVLAGRVTGI